MSETLDLFNRHVLHPWADLPQLGEDEDTSVIVAGEGIYVEDEQGHRMIDGPGGMWCMQTGYGRQEIADAVSRQIMQLGYATSFSVINQPEAELARRIAEQTPGDLNRIFFTTGGSTAVDSALRLCQFINNVRGAPERKHILAREKGYHGSTFLAASVTGKERDRSAFDKWSDRVHFLRAPSAYHYPGDISDDALCDLLIQELEDAIAELGADQVMCYIGEPVLASGGVIVPPADYNRRCLEVCRREGIIYIADEVVTGFGRLGEWFASEPLFDVVPDIITFAKGVTSGYLPLGGFAVSEHLMDSIAGDAAHGNIFSNGFTWSGSPVCCAAALASWDIIERERLLDHVREVGPYFQAQLATLEDIPLVGEVRGMGLMAAIELDVPAVDGVDDLDRDYEIAGRVDRYCQELGLLVRPLINVCVMSPPLVISREQIDDMVKILRQGIERAQQDVRAGA